MTFPLIHKRDRFMDGVVCSCGQVKDEIEVFACEKCSDGMCADCLLDCADCGKSVCYNCTSVFERTVCTECEVRYVARMFEQSNIPDTTKYQKDDVFLVVNGNEYHLDKRFNNIIIDGTDITQPFNNRIKYLDIKGLGLLRFTHRAIRGRGSGNGVEYYISCESTLSKDNLPY